MTTSRKTKTTPADPVRCAIYTRKSTEEGLDQDFNSLDAQREAAEAYIHSQAHTVAYMRRACRLTLGWDVAIIREWLAVRKITIASAYRARRSWTRRKRSRIESEESDERGQQGDDLYPLPFNASGEQA